MTNKTESTVDTFFITKKGKGAYRENLELGTTPLISATNKDNGIIDHVDIESMFKAPAITVERVTGQAYVQLIDFATVPDDIFVLIPREKMSIKKIFYLASQINLQKWRISYSRKITPKRLLNLKVNLNNFKDSPFDMEKMLPTISKKTTIKHNLKYKEFSLRDLFEVIGEGDYHVSANFDDGKIAFISCLTENNGIFGYFDIPSDKTYEKSMTITSDGEYTFTPFYHPYKFNAQDNVLICKPKQGIKLATIFFVMFQLRRMQWRFSYGRKCYSNKIDKIRFKLPVTDNNSIDEQYIEHLLENCYGWDLVKQFSVKN